MRLNGGSVFQPFRHRDFRILWFGAFLSFTGSWIQIIAQGWLVYKLTGSEVMLGLVAFCGSAPVAILGPFSGVFADTFDKRKVLTFSQAAFGSGALFLAFATYQGFVQPLHILGVALLFGLVSTIELPARQATLGRVVPPEDLPSAVPVQAMTFNSARILGPAIGGQLLAFFGAAMCYLVNGLSYLFMIIALQLIKADLKPVPRQREPIKDLLFEGMLYTFRDLRLKTLFLMEATTSTFGLVYLALLPAYVKEVLRMDERGLGFAMTSVGIGALTALLTNAWLINRPYKRRLVILAMATMGTGMLALAFLRQSAWVFPILAIIGGCAVMQFNTTNTLFQTLSPERLRGRVIAMHVWAISGASPFGTLALSSLAQVTKGRAPAPWSGIPLTLMIGGSVVLLGAIVGYFIRSNLSDLETTASA